MKTLWSKNILLPAFAIAALYVVATIYLMNASLVKDAFFGTHSSGYIWDLLIALLAGMWTAMSTLSLFLLIAVALLTGLNLALTAERLKIMRSSGKMHVAVGGSSLLGIVGSGCASCGLPILALLGFGGAAASLPFQGVELSFIALALLSVSLSVLIRGRVRSSICVLEPLKYQEQRISIPE